MSHKVISDMLTYILDHHQGRPKPGAGASLTSLLAIKKAEAAILHEISTGDMCISPFIW
jgi:hypothetical protein